MHKFNSPLIYSFCRGFSRSFTKLSINVNFNLSKAQNEITEPFNCIRRLNLPPTVNVGTNTINKNFKRVNTYLKNKQDWSISWWRNRYRISTRRIIYKRQSLDETTLNINIFRINQYQCIICRKFTKQIM